MDFSDIRTAANEDLALAIQAGRTGLYNDLWERVRRLMYKILYAKLNKVTLPNYISREDMEQELYFAFCNAVNAYDDTKPYKFNSYLELQIKNTFRKVLESSGKYLECSYNQPATDDGETELIDLMPDSNAENFVNEIELTDTQRTVRQAVAALPEREKAAVTAFYFDGATLTQIAQTWGETPEIARKAKNKGIRLLRQNKAIRGLCGEYEAHYCRCEVEKQIAAFKWKHSREKAAVLNELERRKRGGECLSYGDKQRIITLAKMKYIYEQAAEMKGIKRVCGY